HALVAREEAGAPAAAVRHAVDPEEHGSSREPGSAQVLDDGDVRVVAAEMNRQLRRLGQLAASGRAQPLDRDEPAADEALDVRRQGPDGRFVVHRERDEREVLGQRQEAIRVQELLGAEALDAAQEERGANLAPLEEVAEAVGDQAAADAVRLAEVDGELQDGLAHNAAPSAQPAAAAARPAASGSATFTSAIRSSPSSASRCVSSIHVENVVNEPMTAVPASRSASPATPAPVRTPSASEPTTLTASVPTGSSPDARPCTAASRWKRRSAPMPPRAPAASQTTTLTRAAPFASARSRRVPRRGRLPGSPRDRRRREPPVRAGRARSPPPGASRTS